MRVGAVAVGVVLLLLACGRPVGPAPTTSMRGQLASGESPVAGPVDPDPRVGAVFLGGGIMHTCTGSVVHSTAGDLVLTAAHCLAGDMLATFVPGFANVAAPADVWTVDVVYLDPRWVAHQDPQADYAIARVSRADGASVEAQVGSALSLGTAPAPGTRVSVTGYPVGVGGTPIGCQASTGITSGYPSLPCEGLVDGTSGAPWVTGSTVTGVIGGLERGGCAENVSYSAPFDEHTGQLLARAEAGGPGDPPPATFDSGC
jgi:hypothetical protein